MNDKERKEKVFLTVRDLVADLFYYDRKEDEDLPVGAIESLMESGQLEIEEIVKCFREEIENI